MQLTYEDRPDGVRLIHLAGRLDLEGCKRIDLKFATLTAIDRRTVVVDLSAVQFMASLGLATLVSGARILSARGGRMLLAGPQGAVARVLDVAMTRELIPIFEDVPLALAASGASG